MLKILPRDFQHCFISLFDARERRWVTVEATCGRTYLTVSQGPVPVERAGVWLTLSHDSLRRLWGGCTIRRPIVRVFSCVEVVKRILNVVSVRIVTPRQLYDYLRAVENLSTEKVG
jgi:transglutaminase-like putative cysteine protease